MNITVNGKTFDAQGLHSAKEIAEKLHLNGPDQALAVRSEEHTSELQSRENLVCRLLLESYVTTRDFPSFPTRRSSDLQGILCKSVFGFFVHSLRIQDINLGFYEYYC